MEKKLKIYIEDENGDLRPVSLPEAVRFGLEEKKEKKEEEEEEEREGFILQSEEEMREEMRRKKAQREALEHLPDGKVRCRVCWKVFDVPSYKGKARTSLTPIYKHLSITHKIVAANPRRSRRRMARRALRALRQRNRFISTNWKNSQQQKEKREKREGTTLLDLSTLETAGEMAGVASSLPAPSLETQRKRFEEQKEATQLLSSGKIRCLICGKLSKSFQIHSIHLSRKHGILSPRFEEGYNWRVSREEKRK